MPQPMHRGAAHIAFGELPILRFPRLPFTARLPTPADAAPASNPTVCTPSIGSPA